MGDKDEPDRSPVEVPHIAGYTRPQVFIKLGGRAMSDGMEKELRKLYRVVDTMRNVDATLPMQTFAAFLVVAMEEGQSVNQIGNKIGLAQSSASRNVSSLSDWDWRKKTGLQLVEYHQDPMNLSIKTVHLTRKGQKLIEQITDTLKGGSAK